MSKNIEIISNNRKAFHSYTIINRYEAGMILLGSEVKSLREKKLNLKDSFVSIKDEKVWLIGAHISSYSHTGFSGHSPTRNRELLLHKKEMLASKYFFLCPHSSMPNFIVFVLLGQSYRN